MHRSAFSCLLVAQKVSKLSPVSLVSSANSVIYLQGRHHSHSHSHGDGDHGNTPRRVNKPRSAVTRNRRVDSHHSHGYLNGCCHGHSHGHGNDLDLSGTNNFGAEGNHAPVLYVKPGELEEHVRGENLKACRRVTMVGASTNLVYCFLKITLGSQGGSVALLADGVHALVDFGADLISFASVHVTHRKYSKSKFPFGLGRFETLTSLFIAFMLLSGGTALLVSSLDEVYDQYTAATEEKEEQLKKEREAATTAEGGSESQSSGAVVTPEQSVKETTCEVKGCGHNHKHGSGGNALTAILGVFAHDHDDEMVLVEKDEHGNTKLLWPMIAVSVSCLFVKQGMYRWARRVGEKAGSRIVVANAYHHRADSWTSAIALIGVAGQVAGVPYVDGLAGAVVSSLILRTGAFVLRNSVLELFDYQNSDVRCLAEHIRHTVTDQYAEQIPNLIGLYSTRHGHQYSINATMLVRAGETEDLARLCRAQRTLERIARYEHKVNLSGVAVTLHEVEHDRSVPPQHLHLFSEKETLATALVELKSYRPVHKRIRQHAASTGMPSKAAAAAVLADDDIDADEAAHQMHHRRRRVVNAFIVLEEFYGNELVPFEVITINWHRNEVDARIIYDESHWESKKLNHSAQHRLEMLREDLESVCYSLGFDLVKM